MGITLDAWHTGVEGRRKEERKEGITYGAYRDAGMAQTPLRGNA